MDETTTATKAVARVLPAAGDSGGGILEFFNPGALPYAALLIVMALVLTRVLEYAGRRLADRAAAHRLLVRNTQTITVFAVYVTAAVLAFSSVFRLSERALFALSGTIAVTIGFALKDVAAAFLAGISILTNKPFQVGDRISFGGYYGEVKEIGLRTVRLVTLDDNLVTIPSNKFLTDPVASANAGALDCMVVVPFYLDPSTDHARAREIVNDAVLASKYLYLGKPFKVLVSTQVAQDARAIVVLTAKAYVYDTRLEREFASDVTDRVLKRFRVEDIRLVG